MSGHATAESTLVRKKIELDEGCFTYLEDTAYKFYRLGREKSP